MVDLLQEARKASVLRLLAYGMSDTTAENERLKSIATWAAKRTEGYVMADLAAVVERALIAFESRSGKLPDFLQFSRFSGPDSSMFQNLRMSHA